MTPGRARFLLPKQRSSGSRVLEITVDTREGGHPVFAHRKARVVRGHLPVGAFGVVVDGRQVAGIRLLTLDELIACLSDGRLEAQLAGLDSLPFGALIVEDRYAAVFKQRQVRPRVVAEILAESQVRWPRIPIVFADSRRLAHEWAYRFLVAVSESSSLAEVPATELVVPHQMHPTSVPTAPLLATNAEVRAWARQRGLSVAAKGPIRRDVLEAFERATGRTTV